MCEEGHPPACDASVASRSARIALNSRTRSLSSLLAASASFASRCASSSRLRSDWRLRPLVLSAPASLPFSWIRLLWQQSGSAGKAGSRDERWEAVHKRCGVL